MGWRVHARDFTRFLLFFSTFFKHLFICTHQYLRCFIIFNEKWYLIDIRWQMCVLKCFKWRKILKGKKILLEEWWFLVPVYKKEIYFCVLRLLIIFYLNSRTESHFHCVKNWNFQHIFRDISNLAPVSDICLKCIRCNKSKS